MQKQAITPVEDALRILEKTDQLARPAADELKNGEMIQRQVGSRINSRTDGLDQKIRRFLDDLQQLQAAQPRRAEADGRDACRRRACPREPPRPGRGEPDPRLQEPRRALGGEARRRDAQAPDAPAPAGDKPDEGTRPPASKDQGAPKAAEAPKAPGRAEGKAGPETPAKPDTKGSPEAPAKPDGADADPKGRPPEPARAALAEAKTNQKAIADELQKMLDGLKEFDTYRGVVKDAQDLLKAQEQAMKQAAEAAGKPELMGKDARRPQPRAEGRPRQPRGAAEGGGQGVAGPPGEDGRDGQAARRVGPPGRLGHARGRPGEPPEGDRRQDGRGRRAAREEPDGVGAGGAGTGPPGPQGTRRLDPEPPRTRALPARQGAQERRGRPQEPPPAAGPEPQEDPGSRQEPGRRRRGPKGSRSWPRNRPRSRRSSRSN